MDCQTGQQNGAGTLILSLFDSFSTKICSRKEREREGGREEALKGALETTSNQNFPNRIGPWKTFSRTEIGEEKRESPMNILYQFRFFVYFSSIVLIFRFYAFQSSHKLMTSILKTLCKCYPFLWKASF